MTVYTLTFSSAALPRSTLPTSVFECVWKGVQPASALINRAGEEVRSSNDTPQSRGLALHRGREMYLSSRFHEISPSRTSGMRSRTDLKTPTLPQRLRYNKG
jgi:hypothetical protein